MSEHQHTYTPPSITRKGSHGDDMTVQCAVAEFGKLAKENKGKKFPYPEITSANLQTMIEFMGESFTAETLNRAVRKIFGGIYIDNVNEKTGLLNQEDWLRDATDFTEGVDTLDSLKEEKGDIQDEISSLIESPDYMAPEEGQPATSEFLAIEERIKALNKCIGPIKRRIANLEQKNAIKAEKRKATKIANEAKAAAAVAAAV